MEAWQTTKTDPVSDAVNQLRGIGNTHGVKTAEKMVFAITTTNRQSVTSAWLNLIWRMMPPGLRFD